METVYHEPSKSLVVLTDEKIKEIKVKGTQSEYFKILALPEHFSPKHLQAIVGGKLKEGKVLVECTDKITCSEGANCPAITGKDEPCKGKVIDYTRIKLNPHITLHKVEKKMYTREDVINLINKMYSAMTTDSTYDGVWLDGWFETNI